MKPDNSANVPSVGSHELLACPFCGGTNTQIRTTVHWTGMRNVVIAATVTHWCERKEGQLQSFLQLKGKTVEDAVAAWDTRAHPMKANGGKRDMSENERKEGEADTASTDERRPISNRLLATREPAITFNGTPLTEGQAMTVRVAVGHFLADLQSDGLGDDEHGKAMTAGYIARLHEIFRLMANAAVERRPDIRR